MGVYKQGAGWRSVERKSLGGNIRVKGKFWLNWPNRIPAEGRLGWSDVARRTVKNKELGQIQRVGVLSRVLVKIKWCWDRHEVQKWRPSWKVQGSLNRVWSRRDMSPPMAKLWRHHAKWRQLDTKGQSIGFHLHEVLRIGEFIETESGVVVARAWCGREIPILTDNRLSFCGEENVLKLDSGEGCMILWLH